MSPSSRGPTAAPASSIGNDSTSVGPLLPRCAALSSAIRPAATNSTATWPSSTPAEASASATRRSTSFFGSGARGPRSPMTSTSSTAELRAAAIRGALGRPQGRRGALGVFAVRRAYRRPEAVAHDVGPAEADELDALDVAQDVGDDDEARALVARQVDL